MIKTSLLKQNNKPFLRIRSIFSRCSGFPLLHLLLTTWISVALAPSALVLAQAGRAQVITLDSGHQYDGHVFTIQKLSQGTEPGDAFEAELILVIDDGLRRIHVGKHRAGPPGEANNADASFNIPQRTLNNPKEGIGNFVSAGPFNEFGHRELTVTVNVGGVPTHKTFVQGITKITPTYCELKTLVGDKKSGRDWTMNISTRSVPVKVLRSVLLKHIVNPEVPTDFYRIADFFRLTKNYDQAYDELLQIGNRFPGHQEQIRDLTEEITQYKARQVLSVAKDRIAAGQPELGLQLARVTNKEGIADTIKAEFRDLLNTDRDEQNEAKKIRENLTQLIKSSQSNVNAEQQVAIETFQQEIEAQLNSVTLPRLAGYARLADAEVIPNQQKLSLAISGWLMGSNNVLDNLAITQSLFIVRKLAREYLQESTDKLRKSQILNELARTEGATPQNIAAIVRNMLPIEPPQEIETYDGGTPLKFEIDVPGPVIKPLTNKATCLVHLPAEYDPHRKYPLLVTLPPIGFNLENSLNIWCGRHLPKLKTRNGHAMKNGYIVVAVDYRSEGQVSWEYSTREHLIVLRALRKCLRSFAVDPDRVFLSGHASGAEGAFDIGSAHPEHWAGVLGYSGRFDKFTNIYRDSRFGKLPFYVVNGWRDYGSNAAMRDTLNKWLPSKKNFNVPTVVLYKGRLNEVFQEDIPEAFKWMRVLRRRWPGRGKFEFDMAVARPTDNYFWFFEMFSLPADRMVHPILFNNAKINKMRLKGEIEDNVFRLEPNAYLEHDSTVWLSPEFIDFAKQIEIKGRSKFKGFVEPSVEVILNDVNRRADNEHPFWGRIDLKNKRWNNKKRF